jgi:hypothetical protein
MPETSENRAGKASGWWRAWAGFRVKVTTGGAGALGDRSRERRALYEALYKTFYEALCMALPKPRATLRPQAKAKQRPPSAFKLIRSSTPRPLRRAALFFD